MAIFNITSKPYVCPSVSMRVETLDSCNMYIYVDKVEGLSDYAIYVDNTRAFFQPSGVLETETYFRYTYSGTSNPSYEVRVEALCVISNIKVYSETVTYNPNKLPNTTDIYAIFDTTSMVYQDGLDASTALNSWYNQYKANNPDFEGKLYILPYGIENYVNYLKVIKEGTITTTGGNWVNITKKPTNYNSSGWVPPTEILLLGFVDETNSQYHTSILSQGFTSPVQPTSTYTTDLANFKQTVTNFNFFRAVIYPIARGTTSAGAALILQLMAAMKGRILTQAEINATKTQINVSKLLTENPYIGLTPLEDLNFVGVYDKLSPASNVFSSSTFGNELNDIIEQNNKECTPRPTNVGGIVT